MHSVRLDTACHSHCAVQLLTAPYTGAYWSMGSAISLCLFLHACSPSVGWMVYYTFTTSVVTLAYSGGILIFCTLSWVVWGLTLLQFWTSLYLLYVVASVHDELWLLEAEHLLPLFYSRPKVGFNRHQRPSSYGSTR